MGICVNNVNLKIKIKFFLSMQVFHIMLKPKYFIEICCGKDVKKNFWIGEFFFKNSNLINFLIH